MKKWVRIVSWLPVWLIGGVLTLLLIALMVIQLPLVKKGLANLVERVANEQLNGSLEIGSLEGNFFTTLRLNDVLIKQDGDTLAYLEALDLTYTLPPLLKGQMVVKQITLIHPYLNLQQAADSSWNVARLIKPQAAPEASAPKDTGKTALTIQIDRLLVGNGQLDLQTLNPTLPKRVDSLQLDASVLVAGDKQSLQLHAFSFQTIQPYLRLDRFHLILDKQGDLVRLSDVTLATASNTLSLSGVIDLSTQTPSNLTLTTSPLHLEEVAAFLPEGVALKAHPALGLQAGLDGERLELAMGLTYLDQGLSLHLVGLHVVDYLKKTGQTPVSYDLDLAMERFNIDDWTGFTQLNTGMNGNLAVKGQGLDPQTLEATVNLNLKGASLYGHAVDALKLVAGYQAGNLEAALSGEGSFGRLHVQPKVTDLMGRQRFVLNLQADLINVSTFLDTSLNLPPLHLHTALHGQGFNGNQVAVDSLRLLTKTLDLYLQGSYQAKGASDLALTLNLSEASELRALANMDNLDLKGVLTIALQGSLEALNATLDLGLTGFRLDSLAFDSLRFHTAGSIHALKTLDLGSQLSLDAFNTNLNTVINLGDTLGINLSGLNLTYEELVWHQDSGTAVISVGPAAYAIHHVNLSSQAPTGTQRLAVDGRIDRHGEQAFTLRLDSLDLETLIKRFAPELQASGLFNLDAVLTGSAAAPLLQTHLRLDKGRYNNIDFGALTGSIRQVDKNLHVGFELSPPGEGQVWVNGQWPTDFRLDSLRFGLAPTKQTPLTGELILKGLPLALAKPFVPVDDLEGFLNGRVNLTGSLAAPNPQGSISLTQGKVDVNRFGVHYNTVEAGISVAGKAISLDTFLIKSRKGDLQAKGAHHQDTSAMILWFNQFRPIDHTHYNLVLDGQTELALHADSGRFAGSLTIPRAEIYLPALLQLMGQNTPPIQPKPLLVQAMEDRETAEPTHLTIGKAAAPDTVAPVSTTPDTLTKPPSNLFNNLRGDLRIFIPRNTWIKNDDMRLELAGDLNLVKQAAYPELFGHIDVVRGQYNLLGKVFVIQSGTVTFNGGKALMPSLAIEAAYTFRDTERLQRRLLINVTGEATAPKLAFSLDEEPLSEGDALSYILFGSRMDALGASSQQNLDQDVDVAGMAQSAAISLLTSQLTKVVGQAFDVDYISYKNNQNTGTGSFVVGKYITNNLFASYERNFGSAIEQNDQLAEYEMTLEYELFRFLFLQLTSSPIKNGFDVVFKVTVP